MHHILEIQRKESNSVPSDLNTRRKHWQSWKKSSVEPSSDENKVHPFRSWFSHSRSVRRVRIVTRTERLRLCSNRRY